MKSFDPSNGNASHIRVSALTRRGSRRLRPTLLTVTNKRTRRRTLILLPLQKHRPSKQDGSQQHGGTAPVPDSVHAEPAFQSGGNEGADESEDGNAGPHHPRPLADMAMSFRRDEIGHAGRGKGEHRAAEDTEDADEGDGAGVVLGEGPEEEGEQGC